MLGVRAQHGSRGREPGGGEDMGSSAVLLVLIALVVGGYAGWHWRHAYGANADLKVHKTRIPGFRKTRNRSWVITIVLVVLTILLLRAVVK
jgi:hypothetical protein